MTHRRTTRRRAAAAVTGIAALMAGSLAVSQANATTPTSSDSEPRVLSSQEAGQLSATLTEQLSDTAAGSYYDSASGTLIVNVLDAEAADQVEAAGAQARIVENSMAELTAAKAAVEEFSVPGTAWSIDPVSNTVKVTVDSTVTGSELEAVRDGVEALGSKASFERVEGEFTPYLAGGDAIYTSNARCSLGFNVTVTGSPAFLTAGHCGGVGTGWSGSSGGSEVGVTTESVFPGADYALVEYTSSVDAPSAVNLYNGSQQQITGAGEAVVGQEVQRSGSTTGLHGGEVTGLDVSVEYPEGVVRGTIQTNVCAEPGDSGGALFSGSTALGLTSGGSGDCTFGGTTFFYPVADALAATRATLP